MVRCKESSPVVTTYTSSDGLVTRYFVLASGENINLAKAEMNALAEIKEQSLAWHGRIGEIESTQTNPVDFFLNRAALVKEGGTVLAEAPSAEEAVSSVSSDTISKHLPHGSTFAVRTLCIESDYGLDIRRQVEKSIGAFIVKETGAKVDLSNPEVNIVVIMEADRTLVCRSALSRLRRDLRLREPGRKAFFHPSMMNSTLARVMCNLSRVMPGEVVLDPFCGGGGILCEAALIGARVIGSDVNWRLLRGAMTNLNKLSDNYSIVQGDAQNLPLSFCDALVTDPPYGRASSTRGSNASKLVDTIIARIPDIVSRSGIHVCICGSSTMNLSQTITDAGLVLGEYLQIRVHSGLTRDVVTIVI